MFRCMGSEFVVSGIVEVGCAILVDTVASTFRRR
jgi:hypothetical protein